MLKSKRETKFSAELVEVTCTSMNLSSNIQLQKLKKLKEEMFYKDSRPKWPFKIFRLTNLTLREKSAQLDNRKKRTSPHLEVQISHLVTIDL